MGSIMGYTITIGQAIFTAPEHIGDPGDWSIDRIELDDAPHFPDSGRSNCRSPSYGVWHGFARAAGLGHLFDTETRETVEGHICPSYPCVAPLTPEHVRIISEALAAFRAAHPDAQPRCSTSLFPPHDDVGPHDAHLMRLVWLEWWVRWAVEHCTHPAIEMG